MLQAFSLRPEMERSNVAVSVQKACHHLPQGRSGQPRDLHTKASQSLLANPTQASFCEEMEERE